jgi:uncharacterized circularly permuted ATP-grasp superfamily protein/uncharacterized alpha-E superfamily protein
MSVSTEQNDAEIGRIQHLLRSYARAPGVFDEMLEPDGSVRPAWRPLLLHFASLTEDQRRAAAERLARALRDNRVTFIAQGDVERADRPWPLDLFPFVISPEEWAALSAGLAQRARLLNAILRDFYGEQRAVKDGSLPPGVVFGSPQFLRPCSNIALKEDCHLHFLAFDIGRSADGRWWVLSDRTEAPSGAGYALENRIVTSRCLPELFESQNVQRHAAFFRAFNDHFLGLAGRDEPLAVFLSRGPEKRTYFEHSYLARYLGYPVVEGSDLAVRKERLYLKTVEGLRPVDLVMRTVRSEMCDPLELRTDSTIGVPGLLQAVRAGHVVIGNALGSGLVESAAFLSFLPGLCRYYLGEALAIPSVATWWCGQAPERDYVIGHLDELIVRQISSARSMLASGKDGRVLGRSVAPDGQSLIEQLTYRGHDFVAQEAVGLSTAPVWENGEAFRAIPTVLRVFVAATGSGYEVMPGALARASNEASPDSAWLTASDITKDTWVLSDGPVDQYSMLAERNDWRMLRRSRPNLPSRVADSLFWLGRYVERADGALRLLRSLVMRLGGEMAASRHLVRPERIVALLVSQKHLAPKRGKRAVDEGRAAVERELWAVIFDPESRDGLATVLGHVRRNAASVRERLSLDAFRILDELTVVRNRNVDASARPDVEEALGLLNGAIQHVAAFNGLVMENVTRNDGWRFLDIGRRIERVRTTIQLMDQLTVRGDPEENGALELLLELGDSTMTYLNRYNATPRLAQLMDLLLADDSNPRSAVFQLATVAEHLRQLARARRGQLLGGDQRIAIRLISELQLMDVFAVADTVSRFNTRPSLHRICRQIEQGIDDMSDFVSHRYFSHSVPTRLRAGSAFRSEE